MNKSKEKRVIEEWIRKNGAAQFDTKKRNVILPDGGLFAIEKEVKIVPKTKIIVSDKSERIIVNGKKIIGFPVMSKKIKRKGKQVKESVEYYNAYLWFEDIDGTIDYFKKVKKLLNMLGYRTSFRRK